MLYEVITNISLETFIYKPQGDLDSLKIEISKAHAQIRENPIDLKLLLTTLMSDPAFNAALNGKIDFNSLADVIPMDSMQLKGIVQGNLALQGTMSAVEAQDFNRINSVGNFTFSNISIQTPKLKEKVSYNFV